jgi:hypothetical protein
MTGREEEREEDEIERMVPFPAISQQSTEWTRLTRTQLERQYAGPFQDTAIQRWREPADATICYLSVPISASRSVPNETGYVQYGKHDRVDKLLRGTPSAAKTRPGSGSHETAEH